MIGFLHSRQCGDEASEASIPAELDSVLSLPAELDSELSPSDESLLGDAEFSESQEASKSALPSVSGNSAPSAWRWLCCCDACDDACGDACGDACDDACGGGKRGACEKVGETRRNEVLCFEETNVKSLLLPACQPPKTATASERSLASFPVASMPQREPMARRNTVDDANVYSAFDSGLGPFLSSLKTNKRKVVRSSDFTMWSVC